jgi:electron transport complex protein RnfG
MKKLSPLIFIIALVIVCVSLVIVVNETAHGKLELQQDKETLDVLRGVFPEVCYYHYGEEGIYGIYDAGRNEIGYAFYAEGKGYGSRIVILVGIEDKETLRGIDVISHNEQLTMGYASKELDFTAFSEQFAGLNIDDCYLRNDGGQVDAITRATISSDAVVRIVREAVLEKIASIP